MKKSVVKTKCLAGADYRAFLRAKRAWRTRRTAKATPLASSRDAPPSIGAPFGPSSRAACAWNGANARRKTTATAGNARKMRLKCFVAANVLMSKEKI